MFRKKPPETSIATRVEQLQVAALQAGLPGDAAALYNRAGDLLLGAGDLEGAIELYGRAVDDFVEAERFDAGIALCRKIIRTLPAVVRARCTMTWLAIGAGYTAEAASCAVQYTSAAERAGRDRHARLHLRQMGNVAAEHSVRIAVGECLLHLGDDQASEAVFGEVFTERNRLDAPRRDVALILSRVREAALLSPGARWAGQA
jgi:tetratricopeptide (TPR) repeat protein